MDLVHVHWSLMRRPSTRRSPRASLALAERPCSGPRGRFVEGNMEQSLREDPRPGAALAKLSCTSTRSEQAERYHFSCMPLQITCVTYWSATPSRLCRLNAPGSDDVRCCVNTRSRPVLKSLGALV